MSEYKFLLRIVIISFFLLISYAEHALAFDLDMTVEDDIRKNYNSSKLVKDTNVDELEVLPDLPEKLKNEPVIKSQSEKIPAQTLTVRNVKIPKGTLIDVVSTTKISDW